MFHLNHKQIVFTLMLITGVMTSPMASDTDSLVYEDLQFVKKRINLMLNRLNEIDEARTSSMDSILALSGRSLKGLESLEKNINIQHDATRDSIKKKAKALQRSIDENKEKYRQNSILHFIFHGITIGLIIFLVLYLRSERRKSLQYLISKTENMEGGQEEILQKANELEEIRQTLEKTRKQQKKIRKKLKKGKK